MVSSEVVDYLNCYARLLGCIQKNIELFNGLERARKGLLQRLNFRIGFCLVIIQVHILSNTRWIYHIQYIIQCVYIYILSLSYNYHNVRTHAEQ